MVAAPVLLHSIDAFEITPGGSAFNDNMTKLLHFFWINYLSVIITVFKIEYSYGDKNSSKTFKFK
jgi:hypothetical protein